VGGLIQYDPKAASKELLLTFTRKRGVFSDVAVHYGVATTTVRRWLNTLRSCGIDIQPRIDRIRELAAEMNSAE
jgi:DNA-binding IclR family transcriptional regulator